MEAVLAEINGWQTEPVAAGADRGGSHGVLFGGVDRAGNHITADRSMASPN